MLEDEIPASEVNAQGEINTAVIFSPTGVQAQPGGKEGDDRQCMKGCQDDARNAKGTIDPNTLDKQ